MMFVSGYVDPSFSHLPNLGSALSAHFFFKHCVVTQSLSRYAR
ncbi:Uncharacterised protein [Mycobacterium tuberculosis]|jgi:hypothetical protein|nr:Uncharacterised protein [Mycobacterium tuberculosis]